MFFLLRLAFWLGVVLLLLPSGGGDQHSGANNSVSASQAISAASATVGDLRGFCARQPDAYTVGSQVATTLGYRAQAGAKMLYDALTDALAPQETGSVQNGAAKKPTDNSATSQSTLTPADVAPAWRGPPARKDKHPA